MKKLTGIILALLFVVSTGFAGQNFEKKIEQAKAGYINALKSDVAQLRNDAICQIAQLKSRYPNADYSDVRRELNKVVKKDSQPYIRAHAVLAIVYLDDNSLDKDVTLTYNGDSKVFFDQIYNSLQNQYMGYLDENNPYGSYEETLVD